MSPSSSWLAQSFALGLVGLSGLGATGCADPAESAPKPTIVISAAQTAPPEAPSAAPTLEIPSGDAKLTPALEALASCDGDASGGPLARCEARDAWQAHMKALRARERDLSALVPKPRGRNAPIDERLRTSASCVASLRHTSPTVRRAAYDCLADLSDGGLDPALALRVLLERFAQESDPSMRRSAAKALRAVDPSAHGVVPEVLGLARTLVGRPDREDDLGLLVEALIPRARRAGRPPAREAVDFALELAKRREAVPAASELLGREVDRADDACEALVELAERKRGSWTKAVVAIGEQGDRCRAEHPRVVRVLVEVAQGKTGPGLDRHFASAAYDVERFVRSSRLDPKLRAELHRAASMVGTEGLSSSQRERLKALLDELR